MPSKRSVHRKWPRTYFYQLLGMKTSLDTMQKAESNFLFDDEMPTNTTQEQNELYGRINVSNIQNEWESIQHESSFFDDDSGTSEGKVSLSAFVGVTSFSSTKSTHRRQAPIGHYPKVVGQSPSTSSTGQHGSASNQTTQTELPQEDPESKKMMDTLYQDLLQKNTKLRQLEQENEQLLEQLTLIKKEPPIHIEKECATCSRQAWRVGTSSEAELLFSNLLEQARFEIQLEKKEKVYWKKECEKVRGLIDVLEEELSREKSDSVRNQQQCIQQTQEIDRLKYYVETECQQILQHDEAEREELQLQLDKAQSQIRVLQATVQQLSSISTPSEPEIHSFSPKKSTTTPRFSANFEKSKHTLANEVANQINWESYLEIAQRLENELKELNHRREMLQSEYVKIPLSGVQHRRRKDELDTQLDSVDKEIGFIRMKLKTMKFL